jgi:hypothetical protein
MLETHAEKFRREAAECRHKAEEAICPVDRQAWLKLAKGWSRLARGEDLNQECQQLLAKPGSLTVERRSGDG